MADAEVIPIGTGGRPGRGIGSSQPSLASRSLAAGARPARRQPRGPEPSRTEPRPHEEAPPEETPDDQVAHDQAGHDQAGHDQAGHDQAGHDQAGHDQAGHDQAEPSRAQAPRPRAVRSAAHTSDRSPAAEVSPADWLAALQSGAAEVFGTDWEPQLARFLAFLRRRLTGDYAVDEYGFDREIAERLLLASLRPIAHRWFRIEATGVENLPARGGALVVSNHSGTVPVDGLMTMVTVHEHTGRFLRPLGADLVFRLPVVSTIARAGGATLACNEDAERMLAGGELVGVWPEGFKGIGKPFTHRYKLQRFGRGGFVAAALRTGVPIVPLSVVGAEEIYPLIGNVPALARLLGLPYVPVTPTFPWLGPLGLVPLPSKWLMEFGEPIRTDEYDAGAADDPMLVFNVTDQVRETIQQSLYTLLKRRSTVWG